MRYNFDQVDKIYDRTYDGIIRNLLSAYKQTSRYLIGEVRNLYNEILAKGADQVLVSHLYQYDRYFRLLQEIDDRLHSLGQKEINLLDNGLRTMYQDVQIYIDKTYDFHAGINVEAEQRALKGIWCSDGQRWSSRIWRDTGALADRLKQGLFDAVTAGRNTQQLTKDLIKEFDVTFNSADRIVRTELAHIQTQACLDRYTANGVDKYQFLATDDEKTCPICGKLDGKQFSIQEAIVGVNLCPIHPSCRCATLAVLDGALFEDKE